MNFRKHGNTATSECGQYEIRISRNADGKPYYNGWFVPTDKHIEASYNREIVKTACEMHAQRFSEVA